MTPIKALEIQGSVGPGGSERHTLILAKGFKRLNEFDVVVFGPYSRNSEMLQEIHSLGISCYDVALDYDLYFPWRVKQLIKIIKQQHVDVIHTHLRIADIYGAIAGRLTSTPVVATIHGRTGPLEGPRSVKNRLLKLLHAEMLRSGTQKIIAISQFVKDFSREDLNIDPDKIEVIYNCTDPARFDVRLDVDTFRHKLNVAPHEQIVSFIGGISRQKGAHHFVEVADIVARSYQEVKFLVAGKGYFEDEMMRRVSKKNLSKQFIFVGWRPDVPRLMLATDIFVMPAYQEGFGRVTTEAMAAAKPIVAFNSGATSEIVVHGQTGYLVSYGDVKAMACHILELLRDEDKQQVLGQRGRLRMQTKFSPNAFVQHTGRILKSVVA